jgi:proline iminopeptidase
MDLVESRAGQGLEIVKIPDTPKLCDSFQGDRGKVDIGDCSLYTESEPGTGKYPLVLLHGGPGATHHYFHPYLSRAAGSFQSVNYYDQRGCGESDYSPGQRYSIDQAVDDLEALRVKKVLTK